MENCKILIVGDETIVANDLEEPLKSMGHEIFGHASSGVEAIRKAGELKPGLILWDSKIQGEVDGIKAARQIREQLNIPIIFVTAPDDTETIREAKLTEPFEYILKPINKRELSLVIKMAVCKHKWEMERKQMEEERKRVKTQLIQAQLSQATGNLAGGIAHNFNNALVGISGNVGLLERKFKDNETIIKHIKPMKASLKRMVHLTNQLLAYARGGKYRPKVINLHDFTENTLRLIKYSFGSNIRMEVNFPAEALNVEVDEAQMQMVLLALLNNAKEAIAGKGKIRIVGKKAVPGDTGSYACVIIEDNGVGMNNEIKDRIFEPFFTTKGGGRGLGMAAVYGIIQNHDGWISIDSRPGKGTKISVYLPTTETPIAEPEETELGEVGEVSGTGTILIVEDEKEVIDVTLGILEKLGYRSLLAKTGKEAVKVVQTFSGDIDLVLLDIVLPDIPGTEVYPLLKKIRPALKVLVCSGYTIDGPAQELLDAGAQDFIQKPFSVNTLSQKLRKIIMGNS